ncbi:hypothetical protein PENARI_c030G01210 [Penicillium arizonense]|uniref:Uncharacterized protein n=1 Tax=Penicillium arizonense TaxID=1835702 RepID=A0A1F5L5Q1_PENAI|nr:hypothetical protein PENARI_c030G01210 [Penicillium arizonense]OGE48259.1 hypothetical protein PENARI_c030G01210 [Penicillium arizonense]
MPIKLPKSFNRRKSSGNVLEDVEAPQSSFRVFERPGPQRSMTDGAPLTKRFSEGNAVPSMLEDDNIFAETERPLDKHRGNYESSTSTRLSSSSTLPSSTEVPPPDETQSPHSRIHDIPDPSPLSGALRAAGRTFSFGGRFSKSSAPVVPRQGTPDAAKTRPVTGSTDSTATPPKLPDTNFTLGSSDDFNKMFDNMNSRQSVMRDPSPQPGKYSSSPPTHALPAFQSSRAGAPAPINTDRSPVIESPPYSWDRGHHSRPSEEGLLHNPDAYSANHSQSTLDTVTALRRPSPSPNLVSEATTSHRSLDRPSRGQSDRGLLRRSGVYSPQRESVPFDDEDAKMVRQSLMWSKEGSAEWADAPSSGGPSAVDKGKGVAYAQHLSPEPDNMFQYRRSPAPADPVDDSIADNARLAVQFAESMPKSASPGNKVMTPSQFEHYRQQQELRRSNSNATKSDEESDHDDFDDEEDEVEKQRETERQRRKQEAHLSVYRQQMMKITGQQAPAQSLHPMVSGGSSSTPNLLPSRLSAQGDKSTSGKSSEEEDDDVPLGILAAHGFPHRNRPPTRLNNVSSNPNLRASMAPPYISSSSSTTGAQNEGNRGSLPVFARNLPQDPYYGAGIHNGPNRESLAMGGGGSGASVYGGSTSHQMHQNQMPPPGGLVGVIANEERARAMRRGSPNTHAMHDMGGVPRPYSMMPQQQNNVTAGEQASIQLTQQMGHMMQMQMQWMQQMMQMQGGQGQPMMQGGMPMPPMMMPGMPPMGSPSMTGPPSMAGVNPNMRPMSMPAGSALGVPPSLPPHIDQRTLSMLDPNISTRRTGSPMPNLSGSPFRPSTGYAASIAPSERSNAGMASRYRPVSVMQPEQANRAVSPMNKPWGDENHNPALPMSQSHPNLPKSSLATVTVRPVSRNSPSGNRKAGSDEDDDDDEAWADMMKKRDKKKSSWKLKRGTSGFGDLLSAVH